jgi:hypothetical protein
MAEPLIYHRIDFKPADPNDKLRDSIGGHPYLPKGMDYPVCSCGKRMHLYFQFDIRDEFGLPFEAGSHLAVFMCEACNDQAAALHEYFYIDEATARTQDRLRANYWDFNGIDYGDQWTKFYRLMLLKPGGEFEFLTAEEFIHPCSLNFTKVEESWTPDHNAPGWIPEEEEIDFQSEPGYPGTSARLSARQHGSVEFKVGGQPAWGGDNEPPENLLCACGAPMGLVCYVPGELVFPNDRTSKYTYEHVGSLFTGLCVFILACRAQCHPFSVYPVTQP